MLKQLAYIAVRSALISLLTAATGIFVLSSAFSTAFSYQMTRDEQAKINAVSGEIILGGALSFGAIAGVLSLVFGGLELGYSLYRAGLLSTIEGDKKAKARAKLSNSDPLTDDELLKAVAALGDP